MINENLIKSIDAMIDEMFKDELEKSIDIAKDAEETADEAIAKAPACQNDDKNPGRPKQISDVPAKDQDGKRAKDYDSSISEKQKESDLDEADQVKEKNQIKKSLNDAERAELESFRKAKAEKESELKKAEAEKAQENLFKSIIEKTASRYEQKIEDLQKSLKEQADLVKAIAKTPNQPKSITNISALEKSYTEDKSDTFTKSEMLDAAEELVKSGELRVEHVIELENNGFIYNTEARNKLTKKLQG